MAINYKSILVCVAINFLVALNLTAQYPADAVMVEANVPPYTLPDPLLMTNGKKVQTAAQWTSVQRPYLYHLFEENVYGKYPQQQIPLNYRIRETENTALEGKAIRKQVRIFLHPTDTTVFIDVLLYLPNHQRSVPVFVGYNFSGNHATQKDPAIFLPANGIYSSKGTTRPADSTRGMDAGWPYGEIIAQGFGVATAYYGDLEPDNREGWKTGIRTTLKDVLHVQPDEWSAIGAWAWGLSRILDYLVQDPHVDAQKIAVIGHSRLGKAALWAGASDPRFSIVISNESGEGGAALSKRIFGETIQNLNDHFPHWFAPAYKKYSGHAEALPVDQHMLLALQAPRPLYVASAAEDLWSDPKGEFLSAVHAGPVYALFGKKGLGTHNMPPVQQPVGHTIKYHIREGKHNITLYDWQQYLLFAKEQWKIK